MAMRDYRAWHDQYDNPASSLAQRLRIVQERLTQLLSAAPAGPIRVISMCAGQGRDLVGVLPAHARRADVTAVLVELDPRTAELAGEAATRAGLGQVEIIQGDAAVSDVYAPHVPADLVLVCGVFGNISDADVENTVRNVSMLCRTGASVIWTRHRHDPDLTPRIRRWFKESGFEELSFDALENARASGIGAAQLIAAPATFRPDFRFFTFVR